MVTMFAKATEMALLKGLFGGAFRASEHETCPSLRLAPAAKPRRELSSLSTTIS